MAIMTIDDIQIDMTYREDVLFDEEKIRHFINFSQDTASIHTKHSFSRKKGFDDLVVHGFLLSTYFSRILGMELPGENTVIGSINLEFHTPVYLGDLVKYAVKVERILRPLGGVVLSLKIQKTDGTVCVEGKTHCFFKKDNKEEE